MSYKTIQPPFTSKLKEMPKKELASYFAWFMESLPARVLELTEAVREKAEFQNWAADCSPASLDDLGRWFAGEVEMRSRTPSEPQEATDRPANPIDMPSEELTGRTFSLAMDIGMYLSQVLLKSYPALRWEQPLNNKKFIDYGQPVLIEFKSAPFNPVRMVVTLAYGLAAGKRGGDGLRSLYETWAKLVIAS